MVLQERHVLLGMQEVTAVQAVVIVRCGNKVWVCSVCSDCGVGQCKWNGCIWK